MTTAITNQSTNWTIAQKLIFRFFFIFFISYVLLNPNGAIPFIDGLYEVYVKFFEGITIWMGKHILHLSKPVNTEGSGSGDTTYDYLLILFISILALVGCAVWSVIDRKQRNYNKLFYWLAVIIRFYVAFTMITYGYVKVIKLQFPSPTAERLLEPVGNMSPMGLAWTYMGYSVGFNIFVGMGEVCTGLLLIFRRTTTLGALLGLVVAANIMAVNYCFDVPVKILSTILVAMSICLLIRDGRRLANFFILNKPALPDSLTVARFNKKWKNITATVLKYLVVAYVVFGYFYSSLASVDDTPKPTIYGPYKVESFAHSKELLPKLSDDSLHWKRITIGSSYRNNKPFAQIKMMDDSSRYYNLKLDTVHHTMVFNTYADTLHLYKFTYQTVKPGTLQLAGKWNQDSLQIQLQKIDIKNFPLLKRSFRWVNERPFNR
jgi:hypothetical protein